METKQHAKYAGKRTATASVHYITPVPDGEDRGGNMGLERQDDNGDWRPYDDFWSTRRAPNAGLARGWGQREAKRLLRLPEGFEVVDVEIRVERWDEDEIEDVEYGIVLDVEPVTETLQYGQVDTDGTVSWDEPFEEQRY